MSPAPGTDLLLLSLPPKSRESTDCFPPGRCPDFPSKVNRALEKRVPPTATTGGTGDSLGPAEAQRPARVGGTGPLGPPTPSLPTRAPQSPVAVKTCLHRLLIRSLSDFLLGPWQLGRLSGELGPSEGPRPRRGLGCGSLPNAGCCSQVAGAMPATDLPGSRARAVQGGPGRRPCARRGTGR